MWKDDEAGGGGGRRHVHQCGKKAGLQVSGIRALGTMQGLLHQSMSIGFTNGP